MARGIVARFANLPNLISLSRIPMAGAFALLAGDDARLALIAGAATSDVLDGFVARRAGTATGAGALVDAFADRCFVLVAVIVLLGEDVLTPLAAFILAARDIAVLGAWAVTRGAEHYRNFAFTARPAGKAVTIAQFSTLAAAIVAPPLLGALVAITAVTSVIAIVDYARALARGRSVA